MIYVKADKNSINYRTDRGQSTALGHFSVSIFFGQVDHEELKKN